MQAALRRRDTEIGRLGAQVERGRDVDGLVMHHRNETNESIILQLNQQVSICSLLGDGPSLMDWPALDGGSWGASMQEHACSLLAALLGLPVSDATRPFMTSSCSCSAQAPLLMQLTRCFLTAQEACSTSSRCAPAPARPHQLEDSSCPETNPCRACLWRPGPMRGHRGNPISLACL